jgi:hypothetical protein
MKVSVNSSPEPLCSQWVMLSQWSSLLWAHPTLSCLLIAYLLRQSGLCPTVLYGLVMRASPICCSYLSLRVIIRTPTDSTTAFDCCFIVDISLRLLRRVSASVMPSNVSSKMDSLTRLQCSLYATTRRFARPSLTRTFTLELSPRQVTSSKRQV